MMELFSYRDWVCVCTAFLSGHCFLKFILIFFSKDRYFSLHSLVLQCRNVPTSRWRMIKKGKLTGWSLLFMKGDLFRISNFIFRVLNPTSAYPVNFCWPDSICRKGHLEGDFLSRRNFWGKSDERAEMLQLPSNTFCAWKLPAFPAKCHHVNLFQRNKKCLRFLRALLSVIYPFVYIKLTIPTVKQEERFGISIFAVSSTSLSDLQSCKKLFFLVFYFEDFRGYIPQVIWWLSFYLA